MQETKNKHAGHGLDLIYRCQTESLTRNGVFVTRVNRATLLLVLSVVKGDRSEDWLGWRCIVKCLLHTHIHMRSIHKVFRDRCMKKSCV